MFSLYEIFVRPVQLNSTTNVAYFNKMRSPVFWVLLLWHYSKSNALSQAHFPPRGNQFCSMYLLLTNKISRKHDRTGRGNEHLVASVNQIRALLSLWRQNLWLDLMRLCRSKLRWNSASYLTLCPPYSSQIACLGASHCNVLLLSTLSWIMSLPHWRVVYMCALYLQYILWEGEKEYTDFAVNHAFTRTHLSVTVIFCRQKNKKTSLP